MYNTSTTSYINILVKKVFLIRPLFGNFALTLRLQVVHKVIFHFHISNVNQFFSCNICSVSFLGAQQNLDHCTIIKNLFFIQTILNWTSSLNLADEILFYHCCCCSRPFPLNCEVTALLDKLLRIKSWNHVPPPHQTKSLIWNKFLWI